LEAVVWVWRWEVLSRLVVGSGVVVSFTRFEEDVWLATAGTVAATYIR
jgi:hypothetical protein